MTTWTTQEERDEHFRSTTLPHKPADPGDFRFLIEGIDDEEKPFLVRTIDDTGEEVAVDLFASREEMFDMIESFRYAQAVPFEEEFAPFGPAWQREQLERGGR